MSPKRRRPEGPGFGERGGTNVGDYIGRSERMQEAERRAETAERIAEIPIDLIDRSPYQARSSFDRDGIRALAQDIRAHGLNQPITLRPQLDGRYELVAGERRWLAAELAGLDRIQARVRELDDFDAHLVGVSENNQRANLSPWEKALEARELRKHAVAAGRPHTQRDIARYLNRNLATVNQQLAIADAIAREVLVNAAIRPQDACRLPHETLHRIAKLHPTRRGTALKQAVGKQRASKADRKNEGARSRSQVHPDHTADTRWRLWEQGGFRVHIRKPLRTLGPAKARKYLHDLLPGVSALAVRAASAREQDPAALVRWDDEHGRLLFLRPAHELTPARRRAAKEALLRIIADLDAAEPSSLDTKLPGSSEVSRVSGVRDTGDV